MNENLQNQNSNQSQKHDFFAQQNRPKRDYDTNPLIIKNNERLFIILIRSGCMLSMTISVYLLCAVTLFLPDDDNTSATVGFVIVFTVALIVIMRIISRYCSSFDDKIVFYNQHIIFYRNGKKERLIHRLIIKDNAIRPFWGSGLNDKIWNAIIAIAYFALTIAVYFADIKILLFMIFIFVGNFILKLFYFFSTNRNFENFTLFPTILVDTPQIIREKGFFYPKLRNYLICANSDEYDEIKNWFLQTQNLDIENLKRYYFL